MRPSHHIRSFSIILLLVAGFNLFAGGKAEEPDAPQKPAKADVITAGEDVMRNQVEISYAEGFEIEYRDGWTLLRVLQPWPGAKKELTYGLYPRGSTPPKTDCDLMVEVPVERIVVFSTTYLPSLSTIGELDALAGIDNKAYVYSAEVLEMVENGSVVQVGEHPNLDMETLLVLDPDIIMTPVYGVGGVYQDVGRTGMPVVVNADWLETSPLGRAEWIKFIAAFFGKAGEAETYFREVAEVYEALVRKARGAESKPTVMLNTPWQGTWYMPGGDGYQAMLLKDAGAEYLWSDTDGTASVALDFEEVYNLAGDADVWLHTGFWRSKEQALQDDPRFANFKSFNTGNIYNNDARVRPSGASDYWESAPLEPHRVLEDLVRILHPGLLEDGELHFYRKLE